MGDLLQDLVFAEELDNQRLEAWRLWQNRPDLRRMEDWRWTPLELLAEREWTLTKQGLNVHIEGDLSQTKARVQPLQENQPFVALANAMTIPEQYLTYRLPAHQSAGMDVCAGAYLRPATIGGSRLDISVGEGGHLSLCLEMDREYAAHCGVIYIELDKDARLDCAMRIHCDRNSSAIWHINVNQASGSQANIAAMSLGSGLVRADVHAALRGEKADFQFSGVQCARDDAVFDYHLNVRHLSENCTSRQICRSALHDQAFAIFDGMIFVNYGAQMTDASQDSRCLLLSPQASMQANPRLEIYNDDVQCTHGSTVGYLDPDVMFYLRSRGIDLNSAQQLMVMGFLGEGIAAEDKTMRKWLEKSMRMYWETVNG